MKHTEIAAKAAENKAFEFDSNWDSESPISYKNARTLKRYKELCNQRYEVDVKKFDCFFAFSNEQFAKGKASIRPLGEGEELVSLGGGCYGTKDGADRLFKFYDEVNAKIKEECDPQEVYCYEYNNHESFYAFEGDLDAMKLVISIFGREAAQKVKRKSALYDFEKIQ